MAGAAQAAAIANDPAFQYFLPGRRTPRSPILIQKFAQQLVTAAGGALGPQQGRRPDNSLHATIDAFAVAFIAAVTSLDATERAHWTRVVAQPTYAGDLHAIANQTGWGLTAAQSRDLADARMNLHTAVYYLSLAFDMDTVLLQVAVENAILRYYTANRAAQFWALPAWPATPNIAALQVYSQQLLGHGITEDVWPHAMR